LQQLLENEDTLELPIALADEEEEDQVLDMVQSHGKSKKLIQM
jgi:hypothetical protein